MYFFTNCAEGFSTRERVFGLQKQGVAAFYFRLLLFYRSKSICNYVFSAYKSLPNLRDEIKKWYWYCFTNLQKKLALCETLEIPGGLREQQTSYPVSLRLLYIFRRAIPCFFTE